MSDGCTWCNACRAGYQSHCTSLACTCCPLCHHGVCIHATKRPDKANHGAPCP